MQVILRVLHGEGLGEERLWPIGQHLFGRAPECQMRFPLTRWQAGAIAFFVSANSKFPSAISAVGMAHGSGTNE